MSCFLCIWGEATKGLYSALLLSLKGTWVNVIQLDQTRTCRHCFHTSIWRSAELRQRINNKPKGRKLAFFYVRWLQLLIYFKAYLPFQRFTALIDFPNRKENPDDVWRFTEPDGFRYIYICMLECCFGWMPSKLLEPQTHTFKLVFGSSSRSPYVSMHLWDVWCTEVFFHRFVTCTQMPSAVIRKQSIGMRGLNLFIEAENNIVFFHLELNHRSCHHIPTLCECIHGHWAEELNVYMLC